MSLGWSFENQLQDTSCIRQQWFMQAIYRLSDPQQSQKDHIASKKDGNDSQELKGYAQRMKMLQHWQNEFWALSLRFFFSIFISIDFVFHILPFVYLLAFGNILNVPIRIGFLILFVLIECIFFFGLYFFDKEFHANYSGKKFQFLLFSIVLSVLSISPILFVILSPSNDINLKTNLYSIRKFIRYIACFGLFFLLYQFGDKWDQSGLKNNDYTFIIKVCLLGLIFGHFIMSTIVSSFIIDPNVLWFKRLKDDALKNTTFTTYTELEKAAKQWARQTNHMLENDSGDNSGQTGAAVTGGMPETKTGKIKRKLSVSMDPRDMMIDNVGGTNKTKVANNKPLVNVFKKKSESRNDSIEYSAEMDADDLSVCMYANDFKD